MCARSSTLFLRRFVYLFPWIQFHPQSPVSVSFLNQTVSMSPRVCACEAFESSGASAVDIGDFLYKLQLYCDPTASSALSIRTLLDEVRTAYSAQIMAFVADDQSSTGMAVYFPATKKERWMGCPSGPALPVDYGR